MKQLLLVRHAATSATARGAFAADEEIDKAARGPARGLAAHLPAVDAVLSSPARRCRQTAAAIGMEPDLEPDLSECDFGSWEGRTFAEITGTDPSLTAGWLRDPEAAPHGGESLSRFAARVGTWLDAAARGPAGSMLAFTHAGVIKAAVVRALAAPLDALWKVTVAPLSITELHAHEGVWTLVRVNWTAQSAGRLTPPPIGRARMASGGEA